MSMSMSGEAPSLMSPILDTASVEPALGEKSSLHFTLLKHVLYSKWDIQMLTKSNFICSELVDGCGEFSETTHTIYQKCFGVRMILVSLSLT